MSIAKTVFLMLVFAAPAHADSVKGFCERDGKRLTFTDGIAFADARDEDGVVSTTIYLTARPLDRAALARCAECAGPLPQNTFGSPRGDLIEAQRSATAAGWMEIGHTGGELDITTIVNVMYLADDGVLTGIDGGNGRVAFDVRNDTRAAGRVFTEAHEPPYDETDMTCDIKFDLVVGWPGVRKHR